MPWLWHWSGSPSDLLAAMHIFLSFPVIWLALFPTPNPPKDVPSLHPLHLSKSVVEYFPEEKTLRVSLHLFLDDLEKALNQNRTEPLFLGSPREPIKASAYLEAYLQKQFSFALDGKSVPLRLLGKELSEDREALWCYLEIAAIRHPGKISVTCTLLTDIFRDQQNILHFIYPGIAPKTALLGRNRTKAIFVIQK